MTDNPDSNPLDEFIESWGAMGVQWGINRSMARIQALMMVSEEPIGLDEVSERLNISRGNASMSLKELRNWGVIRRVQKSGDRKDYYVAEPDPWRMLFLIAVEQKKRVFDPAHKAVRDSLGSDAQMGEKGRQRLVELEKLLTTFDGLATRLLTNEEKSKTMFHFFTAQVF